MSFVVFSASYFDETQIQYNNFYCSGERADGNYGLYSFYIKGADKDPIRVYEEIDICLKKVKANLYTILYSQADKTTTKLIYCSDTGTFDDLLIEEGRFFNDNENKTDYFLSTTITGDQRQIGRIAKFDNNYIIRTIYSEVGNDVFSREFTLLLPEGKTYYEFSRTMKSYGYELVGTDHQRISLESQQEFYKYVKWVAIIVSMLIMTMIIIFSITNSFRKIGIEKMMGYSLFKLWTKRMPIIFLYEFIIVLFGLGTAFFLLFNEWSVPIRTFLLTQFLILCGIIVLTALISFLPLFLTKKIKISDVLKNRRPTTLTIGINTGLKIILSVGIMFLLYVICSQSQMMTARYNTSYVKWEEIKNYAIIRYVITNDGLYDPFDNNNIQNFKSAYYDFDRVGAIFADFSSYSQDEYFLKDTERFAIVNKNYLDMNYIFDTGGERVQLEDTGDYILLVPEKFKIYEKEILDYHNRNNTGKQSIRIIWIDNDQNCFTYNLEIEPETGNNVKNAILHVITDKNSIWTSNIASSVLLIPIENPDEPMPEINNVMGRYFDSDQVAFAAFGIYSLVNEKIATVTRMITALSILLIVVAVVLACIILQNIRNYFEQYKQRIAIQHCMGFDIIKKYKGLIVLFLLSSFIELVCLVFIIGWKASIFWIVAVGFDLIITIIFTILNERKNVLRILKGG